MKIRVYIAGPYTKGDVAANVAAAMRAGHRLMDLGLAPYVPHLTHFIHLVHQRSYEDWMVLDLEWLPLCHAVLRLPGESSGADREVADAERLGIPVFWFIEHLRIWAEGREPCPKS